jgi:predicted nuclease of restriction endonuclease-like (RecB) superfamily
LKDPYVLDFLELNDQYIEKDLEDAILRELEQFIWSWGLVYFCGTTKTIAN